MGLQEYRSPQGQIGAAEVGVISFFVLFVALDLKKSHNINRLGIA